MSDVPPTQPPSKGVPQLFQNLGSAVTILVTVVGLVGSILGYFATFKSNANAAKIQDLQQQFDQAEKFASDIHRQRRNVASQFKCPGNDCVRQSLRRLK